jgi:hypothetical protein
MVDALTAFKSTYSVLLLIFSVVIIMTLIWNEDTKLSQDVHASLAYVCIWGAVIWFTMVEGGRGSLVGLSGMAIEFSGLLHCSYLVQMLVSNLSGKSIESQEEPRTPLQSVFFWFRYLMSLVILALAFTVTLGALFQGKTTMWDRVPEIVSVIIFFILMPVVGMLEGMQIAFFAVSKLPKSERGNAPFAMKTC